MTPVDSASCIVLATDLAQIVYLYKESYAPDGTKVQMHFCRLDFTEAALGAGGDGQSAWLRGCLTADSNNNGRNGIFIYGPGFDIQYLRLEERSDFICRENYTYFNSRKYLRSIPLDFMQAYLRHNSLPNSMYEFIPSGCLLTLVTGGPLAEYIAANGVDNVLCAMYDPNGVLPPIYGAVTVDSTGPTVLQLPPSLTHTISVVGVQFTSRFAWTNQAPKLTQTGIGVVEIDGTIDDVVVQASDYGGYSLTLDGTEFESLTVTANTPNEAVLSPFLAYKIGSRTLALAGPAESTFTLSTDSPFHLAVAALQLNMTLNTQGRSIL